ncbi:hypothetical protein IMG5_164720 [Ichthyophthirius multifiliis]|uniref:protein-tyrosine-phosphatase n=1 Tax=Ichthyophthirius multifiliis TaxID=5932 RepID=G0R0I8_ICHMU|nr:hypothetical protein IMG5_164720 [Ichthyophthirius multifiliis]EGR29013.1 hypothetical protein IMG5_164720 [Ichthyophthirius multifiliis]|eukprot:XP_004030249.1 hypothetical protein IMG5_164720 [Ichthyophthirius multifiliis]
MNIFNPPSQEISINCLIPPDENRQGGLFIGNYKAALSCETLINYNIKGVLTTSIETPVSYQTTLVPFHMQLDIHDSEDFDISQYFEKSAEFIELAMEFGNVLVHCYMGISRSATICIAYLMKKQMWSLEKALWICQEKRQITNPNNGFMRKLMELERKLFNQNTIIEKPKQNFDQNQQQTIELSQQQLIDYPKQQVLPQYLQQLIKQSGNIKIVQNNNR